MDFSSRLIKRNTPVQSGETFDGLTFGPPVGQQSPAQQGLAPSPPSSHRHQPAYLRHQVRKLPAARLAGLGRLRAPCSCKIRRTLFRLMP